MKNIKKLTLLTVLSLGILTACATEEEAVVPEEEGQTAEITIIAGEDIVVEKEVEINGEPLQEILANNFELEEEDGFITAIEGIPQVEEDNTWWMFEVNGEMPQVGANEYIVQDEDEVVWELTAF